MNISLIEVQNLKYDGCAHTITTKLSTLKNISNLQIDDEENKASFDYVEDADHIGIKEKLNSLGYPSVEDSNPLTSKAKSFVSCDTDKLSK